jgi:hypothetical protein
LIETLEILADEAAVAGLVEARREVADAVWFDADHVTQAVRRAGREGLPGPPAKRGSTFVRLWETRATFCARSGRELQGQP